MAETLFSFDKRNFRDCQHLFRGARDLEYYQGDYWIEDAGIVDVRAQRKPVGAASVILLRSLTRLHFRRTRQHIRDDATDLTVLWFVRHGKLVFSNQCGEHSAQPGDFLATRSMSPFLIECQPEEGGVHEVLHVTVPTHLVRAHIPHDFTTSLFMAGARRDLVVAENILTDIFEDDGNLADDTVRTLFDAAVTVIGHAVRASKDAAPVRQTVAGKRLEDVLRFIEVHLADPNLSTQMVSKGCGISPRYLSFLLRLNGTSFSGLLWDQRLDKAREWLASSSPRDIAISEIAYGVGFKSPAHFSRMFKRVFSVNPREYRGDTGRTLQ
jgi:AraC-like DNA-binding protein